MSSHQVELGSEECKGLFLLSSEYIFLNHGSFGTVPRSVNQAYRDLLDEVEACPDTWFRDKCRPLMMESRNCLAPHLKCSPDSLVFVENATTGIHSAIISAGLSRGDAVLVTNWSYPGIANTSRRFTEKSDDIVLRVLPMTLPLQSPDEVVQAYRSYLTAHSDIKVAVIDHITSPSAIVLPVKDIIKVCREFNVVSIVDGAHSVGQLDLDLPDINPDYYTSNIHKWLYTPRGCAFLYIRSELHDTAEPILASNQQYNGFPSRFFYQATRDYTPYCVVPKALEFQQNLGGRARIVEYCRDLCTWAAKMLSERWSEPRLPIPDSMRAPNMALIRVPGSLQGKTNSSLVSTLLNDYKIVCSSIEKTAGELWLRISCNVYNTRNDYMRLAEAVVDLMNNPDKVI